MLGGRLRIFWTSLFEESLGCLEFFEPQVLRCCECFWTSHIEESLRFWGIFWTSHIEEFLRFWEKEGKNKTKKYRKLARCRRHKRKPSVRSIGNPMLSGSLAHLKRGSVVKLNMMELSPSPCRTRDVDSIGTRSSLTKNWEMLFLYMSAKVDWSSIGIERLLDSSSKKSCGREPIAMARSCQQMMRSFRRCLASHIGSFQKHGVLLNSVDARQKAFVFGWQPLIVAGYRA